MTFQSSDAAVDEKYVTIFMPRIRFSTNSEYCDAKPPPQLFAQFFVDEETLKIWQHDIALQAEKDTLLLCHFAASTHIGISASATDQKPAKTCTCKGGSNATWRPTRRRRRATLSAKDPPCVHYQKSDHLFCESLFVPPGLWIFCMKCISKIRAKNFQVHTSWYM